MTFKIGDRVKLHPASTWFARGAKYATVTSVPKGRPFCFVRLENIGPKRLRCPIPLYYLELAESR